MSKSVVIIATSNDAMGDTGNPTGCWAEEIMAPSMMFQKQGYVVTIASMKGGKIPIDQNSLSGDFKTTEVTEFLESGDHSDLRSSLENSVALKDLKAPGDYDAVFVPGGHGVCWDMLDDKALQSFLASAYEGGKLVASVCHGPVCLVNTKLSDGQHLIAGKNVTGFSNSEEKAVGLTEVVPVLLEDSLKKAGANYSAADDWSTYVQVDGRLITGQNPGSSKAVASEMIKLLG